jgi:hypothetical protein
MVVLDEAGIDSRLSEALGVVRFHEESASVAQDRRLDQQDPR